MSRTGRGGAEYIPVIDGQNILAPPYFQKRIGAWTSGGYVVPGPVVGTLYGPLVCILGPILGTSGPLVCTESSIYFDTSRKTTWTIFES